MVALGDVAEFVNGAAFKPTDWSAEGFPIIRIQNLTSAAKPFNRTSRSVNPRLYVQPGDLLVSWSATLGVFEWSSSEVGVLNQHIFRVIPNEGLVDRSYLRHSLAGAIGAMNQHLHGATMKHINRAEFLATSIPLPPLPEQRRIATILDEATRALEVDAQAAEARSGVVSAALESVLRIEAPNYVELATICTRITDGTHQSPSFTTSGVPFLFISNIIGGSVNYETAKFVSQETFENLTRSVRAEPGDILYSAVGSYGVPARVESDRPVVFQRHIAHIKPDARKVNSVYLREVMASPAVKQQADRVARGGAQKTVTLGDLAKFRIPLVSESAQEAIEQFAHASAKANSLVERRRALLTELKASLSGRLFMPTTTRADGEL